MQFYWYSQQFTPCPPYSDAHAVCSFVDVDILMAACSAVFLTFHTLSCDVLSNIIRKLNKTTCVLEKIPTKLLMSYLLLSILFYIL